MTGARATKQVYGPGDLVGGKYKLIRSAGQGAMGEVWVARNVTLDQPVALKLFNVESEATTRSLQEAKAAARLNHPGIVRTFDLGRTPKGAPYIVMELLEGQNLAAHIRAGKKSPIEATRILLPIVSALAAAHRAGVVHRDIKPANLFLAKGDAGRLRPVVVDFGLAKPRDEDGAKITVEGTLLGSPHYMSPEQVQALPADERSDIWSLCVVLYELVSGHVPFREVSEYRLLRKIVEGQPTPLSMAHDSTFRSIVMRGLAKEPAARWPSMRELGGALAKWLIARGVNDDVTATALQSTWLSPVGIAASDPPAALDPDGSKVENLEVSTVDELSWDAPLGRDIDGEVRAAPGKAVSGTHLLRPSQAPTRDAVGGALMTEFARVLSTDTRGQSNFGARTIEESIIEIDPERHPSVLLMPPNAEPATSSSTPTLVAATSGDLQQLSLPRPVSVLANQQAQPPAESPTPPKALLDSMERRAAATVIIGPEQGRMVPIAFAIALLLGVVGIVLVYVAIQSKTRSTSMSPTPTGATTAETVGSRSSGVPPLHERPVAEPVEAQTAPATVSPAVSVASSPSAEAPARPPAVTPAKRPKKSANRTEEDLGF